MWLARDKVKRYCIGKVGAGELFLFEHKPRIKEEFGTIFWGVDDDVDNMFDCIQINRNRFPEVTFENSPIEVELKIKENKHTKR